MGVNVDKRRFRRKKKETKNFQKNFPKHLRDKKRSCTFAPALRETLNALNKGKKQEEHVLRHIELTAVLREILRQKNKSNRIERFEKTTREFSRI